MKTTKTTAIKLAQAAVGLIVCVGAVFTWHHWHIDGFLAALIALGGLAVAYNAFGVD